MSVGDSEIQWASSIGKPHMMPWPTYKLNCMTQFHTHCDSRDTCLVPNSLADAQKNSLKFLFYGLVHCNIDVCWLKFWNHKNNSKQVQIWILLPWRCANLRRRYVTTTAMATSLLEKIYRICFKKMSIYMPRRKHCIKSVKSLEKVWTKQYMDVKKASLFKKD